MIRQVVIIGGGTAGWLTAAYLARMLATRDPRGIAITLIESPELATVGVGEGTFPSILRTLRRIGLDENTFVRESGATFKQGVHFVNWQRNPASAGRNDYFHPFQSAQIRQGGLDLLPYWLLGLTPGMQLDEATTIQKRVADASRAPKRLADAGYDGTLSYAYHFDAVSFASTLRSSATQLGVRHIADTVDAVELDERGFIASVVTRERGHVRGDLYVDCSGFRARLIGQTYRIPLKSCLSTLFCDRAVAMQVPYDRPDAPIASYTISTAQEAGWTWDIGLNTRRGVGYVYSSAYSTEERAERILREHIGGASCDRSVRTIKFEAGYRETSWYKNCVAVGLAGGFFEPLEATGIVFIEVAAILLAHLFPWNGELEVAARQFNCIMTRRYERARDFLKLHYCLTRRTDSAFWTDNTLRKTIPDSLQERLDRWRHRPPEGLDFDMNFDSFADSSWQFVLYGMGFRTDLSAKAATYRYCEEARREFAAIQRDSERAAALLPSHRALVNQLHAVPRASRASEG